MESTWKSLRPAFRKSSNRTADIQQHRSRRTCTRARYIYHQPVRLASSSSLVPFLSGARLYYKCCFFPNTNLVHPYFNLSYHSDKHTIYAAFLACSQDSVKRDPYISVVSRNACSVTEPVGQEIHIPFDIRISTTEARADEPENFSAVKYTLSYPADSSFVTVSATEVWLENTCNYIEIYRKASIRDIHVTKEVWVEKLFTFFYFPKKEKR
jgi:hypothetical protein